MQFLDSWATNDRKVLLTFSKEALETFKRFIQHGSFDNEAGGLLLGTVHGANMGVF